MDQVVIDWQEYLRIMGKCVQKLKSFEPFDIIYAPMRGGLIPAVIASHAFDVRMYPIDITEDGKVSVVANDPVIDTVNLINKKVLLIDDIADSGKTLKKCVEYLKSKGYFDIVICTLIVKQKSAIVPDVTEKSVKNEWVIFPYEQEK